MPLGSFTAFHLSVTVVRHKSALFGETRDGAGGAVVSGGVVGVFVGFGGFVTFTVT